VYVNQGDRVNVLSAIKRASAQVGRRAVATFLFVVSTCLLALWMVVVYQNVHHNVLPVNALLTNRNVPVTNSPFSTNMSRSPPRWRR